MGYGDGFRLEQKQITLGLTEVVNYSENGTFYETQVLDLILFLN